MQKVLSYNSLFLKLIPLTLIFIVLLMLVVLSQLNLKITRHSNNGLYTGNVGVGETGSSDTIPPTVSVTNPINNSSVFGTVNVTANATDNVAVSSVTFFVDGSSIGTTFSAPYSSSWNVTIYPNNSQHTIIANALDASGNQASSSAVSVTVLDITAPTVAITNPTNGAIVPRNTTVTITANSADVSGVQKVEFRVNNVLKCTDSAAPYFCNWSVPPQKNKPYTIEAKSYDNATNTAIHTINVTSSN